MALLRRRSDRVGVHARQPSQPNYSCSLGVTKGQAGQAIAVSGIFAGAGPALFITVIIGRLDRRIVLIALTSLMAFLRDDGFLRALITKY